MGLTAAAVAAPYTALSKDYVTLAWDDLLPEGSQTLPSSLQALMPHDETSLPAADQPPSSGVRTDYNGQTVRLPGFVLPIEFDGTAVTAFILVPFVGACVHVPPPPANQLVFVTTETPYQSKGLFEAVSVVGLFGTTSTRTDDIDIGYALAAREILPYA